jgi:type II secretion system protein H
MANACMTTPARSCARVRSGFTLIELILVMALLAIVIGVCAPSLSTFFRGRSLESEARRFLSLTHYAQSRAASEGVPVILWVDEKAGSYGLQIDAGYVDGTDPKAIAYNIGEDLRFEVLRNNSLLQKPITTMNLPVLRFLPDGSISEQSVPGVILNHANNERLWIVQTRTGLTYEIRNDEPIQSANR